MAPRIAQAAADVIAGDDKPSQPRGADAGKVCVVIRAYEAQMHGIYRLEHLLKSLDSMHYRNWEAIVLPTESAPIPKLYNLISRYNNEYSSVRRIRVVRLGDVAAPRKTPTSAGCNTMTGACGSSVAERRHALVYEQTDDAIAHCSRDAEWLLVTNGDNAYHATFFNHLDAAYDLVAFDFYSRSVESQRRERGGARARFGAHPARTAAFARAGTRTCSIATSSGSGARACSRTPTRRARTTCSSTGTRTSART